jgi:DNA-binding NtrC family response regulator
MANKTNEVYQEISRAVQSDFNVAVEGESGVGKQHFARLIHQGRNRGGEFMVFDCERGAKERAAIVEQLASPKFLERLRQSTKRDTVFIRRIDLLEGQLLAKFSDSLEELGNDRAFPRSKLLSLGLVGSLLSGDHRSSRDNMQLNKLLDSLFCLRMKILPLRERKDEIPQLVDKFIVLFNREQKRSVLGIARDALGLLLQYNWPDNVRELRTEIEGAATLTEDHTSIEPSALSESLIQSVSNVGSLDRK